MTAVAARGVVTEVHHDPRHEFWADEVSYTEIRIDGVLGHRQVADAYVAGLARRRGATLATFDGGLATVHPDVAQVVPVS